MRGFWRVWSPSAAAALRPGLPSPPFWAPEDYGEFLSCCDGLAAEAFWFAEPAPGALAYRVARLLSLSEAMAKARRLPEGWLPVAMSREGALSCLRLERDDESAASFGEVWSTSSRGSKTYEKVLWSLKSKDAKPKRARNEGLFYGFEPPRWL